MLYGSMDQLLTTLSKDALNARKSELSIMLKINAMSSPQWICKITSLRSMVALFNNRSPWLKCDIMVRSSNSSPCLQSLMAKTVSIFSTVSSTNIQYQLASTSTKSIYTQQSIPPVNPSWMALITQVLKTLLAFTLFKTSWSLLMSMQIHGN